MIFDNVLNEEQRNEFLESFLDIPKEEIERRKGIKNKWGQGHLPIAKKFLPIIEPLVFGVIGSNYTANDTYTRAYYNDSSLNIHTDRPTLDITVSLCLRRDTPWALNVSTIPWEGLWSNTVDHTPWLNNYNAYDLLPGQAVICLGNKNPHWRNTLICSPDQTNIYTFYHWISNDKLDKI